MIASRDVLMDDALAELNGLMSYQRRAFCARPVHRDLSMPQLYILVTLQERGPMSVSALAQLLRISTPSASSIVDRMVEHGFVERTRVAVDRRVVHVQISSHGHAVVDELAGMKRDHVQRLLGAMTDDELYDVIRGMGALSRALARAQAAPSSN